MIQVHPSAFPLLLELDAAEALETPPPAEEFMYS